MGLEELEWLGVLVPALGKVLAAPVGCVALVLPMPVVALLGFATSWETINHVHLVDRVRALLVRGSHSGKATSVCPGSYADAKVASYLVVRPRGRIVADVATRRHLNLGDRGVRAIRALVFELAVRTPVHLVDLE